MLRRIVGRVVHCTHWDFPREGSHGIDKAHKALQKPIAHHSDAHNLIAQAPFWAAISPFMFPGLWPVSSAISKAPRVDWRPHRNLGLPVQVQNATQLCTAACATP